MIPPERIAELASLYDRFANALDPFSEDRDEAESEFSALLERLHMVHGADTDRAAFRREAVRQ